MGRKERRRYSKQQRKLIARDQMTMADVRAIKRKAFEQSNKNVTESILPLLVLYLVENFHCKQDGVTKFMNWLNQMLEWIDKTPNAFDEIRRDLEEKAGVEIKY